MANFKKGKEGTVRLFNAVGSFKKSMMNEEASINWKQELDEYLDENK